MTTETIRAQGGSLRQRAERAARAEREAQAAREAERQRAKLEMERAAWLRDYDTLRRRVSSILGVEMDDAQPREGDVTAEGYRCPSILLCGVTLTLPFNARPTDASLGAYVRCWKCDEGCSQVGEVKTLADFDQAICAADRGQTCPACRQREEDAERERLEEEARARYARQREEYEREEAAERAEREAEQEAARREREARRDPVVKALRQAVDFLAPDQCGHFVGIEPGARDAVPENITMWEQWKAVLEATGVAAPDPEPEPELTRTLDDRLGGAFVEFVRCLARDEARRVVENGGCE